MAVKQLSDGGSEGVVMGQSADDLVGFFGTTPAARMAYSAAMSATRLTGITVLSGGSNYGYSSSNEAGYIKETLERLVYMAKLHGLWPSSA